MKRIGLVLVTLGSSLFALGTVIAHARHKQPSSLSAIVDVESVGPKVGEAIPDFNLPDQRRQVHSLTSLLGPNGAVLVFFRSADW